MPDGRERSGERSCGGTKVRCGRAACFGRAFPKGTVCLVTDCLRLPARPVGKRAEYGHPSGPADDADKDDSGENPYAVDGDVPF